MKKKLFIGALVSLMSIPMAVNAAGVSTVKFEGNTNVNVGDEFKVNMVLDNIEGTNGGIVAFGGYITFDNNVLELVSSEKGDAYDVIINENINKIAALDYTLANGIKERTNVYTMTFKAIGEGNTSVSLTNGEVDDINSTVDFNVEELNINSKKIISEPVNTINSENTYNKQYEIKNEKPQDNKVEIIKNMLNNFFNKR
ncbi:MAG: hypothetical protein J5970_02495 [Bacilli bacterium]|nr:hypothetical protein [Bacilli bacterium]